MEGATTKTIDKLKSAASRLLGRRRGGAKAEAPATLPSTYHNRADSATRGGRAAARSLARLSATSVISDAEDESPATSLATSAADIDVSDVPTATTASASGSTVSNAVAFSRKTAPSTSTTTQANKPSASDIVSGRFDLNLPRDLDARYDVSDKILGSGGSGVVRLATSKRTGKTVAVKTIPKVRKRDQWRADFDTASVVSEKRRRYRSKFF